MGKKFKYLDKPLLFISILLFIIGLIMVFSASNVTAYMSHAVNPYHYFIKQAVFLVIGIVLFFVMIVFNTNVYGKVSHLLLIGNIAALVALLVYGSAKNDAVSWFELGFGVVKITIQPSEFIKVISIVKNGVVTADIYGLREEKEYEIVIENKVNEVLEYTTSYVKDYNLEEGMEEVKQKGANGAVSTTYKITKFNGAEISREILSTDMYSPLESIVKKGMKKVEETNAHIFVDGSEEEEETEEINPNLLELIKELQ